MIPMLIVLVVLALVGVGVAIVVAGRIARSRMVSRPMKIAGVSAVGVVGLMSLVLAVTVSLEVHDHLTLERQVVVVTVTESRTGTRTITQTTLVGKMVTTIGHLHRYTEFRTEEFQDFSFEASGHHNWGPGEKVRLRIFLRRGQISTYDILSAE